MAEPTATDRIVAVLASRMGAEEAHQCARAILKEIEAIQPSYEAVEAGVASMAAWSGGVSPDKMRTAYGIILHIALSEKTSPVMASHTHTG